MYENTYGTARLVLGIVAISGWLVLAVGVIAIVSSFFAGGEPNLTMMMAGIAMLASGLVLVAASQSLIQNYPCIFMPLRDGG